MGFGGILGKVLDPAGFSRGTKITDIKGQLKNVVHDGLDPAGYFAKKPKTVAPVAQDYGNSWGGSGGRSSAAPQQQYTPYQRIPSAGAPTRQGFQQWQAAQQAGGYGRSAPIRPVMGPSNGMPAPNYPRVNGQANRDLFNIGAPNRQVVPQVMPQQDNGRLMADALRAWR